jgi:hypothetical protein
LFFDPRTQEFVDASSFLDFVAGRFIKEVGPNYVRLFQRLVVDEAWEPRAIPTAQLQPLETVVEVSADTGIGIGMSVLMCQQATNGQVNYFNLISPTRREYIQNHQAFFCASRETSNLKMLDARSLLKAEYTLPLTLTLGSLEEINNTIASELNKLATLTIDQNALLNDVKKYVGSQTFEPKIQKLQAQMAEAERRAQKPGVLEVLKTVASGAGAVAGMESLVPGAIGLVSLIADVPSDDAVLYLIQHQESFEDNAKKLNSGAAAVGTLMDVIDHLDGGRGADISSLREQLATVQQAFTDFQTELAATANIQRRQYLDTWTSLIGHKEQQQRILLSQLTSVNKAVIRELLGAKLAKATPEAVQVCQLAAAGFVLMPSQTTVTSLNENCGNYPSRVKALLECIGRSPRAPGFTLFFGGHIGLLIADDRKQTNCFTSQ